MLRKVFMLATIAMFCLPASALATPALPVLNIDVGQTSISGISSGGFMAAQFQVAHASTVIGAGIVAGGPYFCAQNDALKAVARCSCTGEPTVPCAVDEQSTDLRALLFATRKLAAQGKIDPPEAIARQKVLTLSGRKDTLVPPAIAEQLGDFYKALGLPASNLSAISLPNAAHTMPTANYGSACDLQDEPYIGKCGFDSAKNILSWIYGPLKPASSGQRKGNFLQFDQHAYLPSDSKTPWKSGLDDTGWLYVPNSCARGEACRLHIVLHGCKQGQSFLPLHPPPGGGLYNGTTFVRNTGYDRWADNNHLVILYPQAVSIPWSNPNGCWDWWGYTGADYATKNSVQIRSLKAMVDQLGAGRRP